MEINRPYKKIALSLALCLLLIWGLLGTGASLAWFKDTSVVKNIIHVAEFDLEVYHKLENGSYEIVGSDTELFDKDALYEPGYTQIVYLKIHNNGNVSFDYQTAVTVYSYVPAINYYGQTFNLQKYLKFGIVTADSEDSLNEKLKNRDLAKEKAIEPLNNYSTEKASLNANSSAYVALIVRMPESVCNEANYRGDTVPQVNLGVIVTAHQQID